MWRPIWMHIIWFVFLLTWQGHGQSAIHRVQYEHITTNFNHQIFSFTILHSQQSIICHAILMLKVPFVRQLIAESHLQGICTSMQLHRPIGVPGSPNTDALSWSVEPPTPNVSIWRPASKTQHLTHWNFKLFSAFYKLQSQVKKIQPLVFRLIM